jgi:hypothetical protein
MLDHNNIGMPVYDKQYTQIKKIKYEYTLEVVLVKHLKQAA